MPKHFANWLNMHFLKVVNKYACIFYLDKHTLETLRHTHCPLSFSSVSSSSCLQCIQTTKLYTPSSLSFPACPHCFLAACTPSVIFSSSSHFLGQFPQSITLPPLYHHPSLSHPPLRYISIYPFSNLFKI